MDVFEKLISSHLLRKTKHIEVTLENKQFAIYEVKQNDCENEFLILAITASFFW